MRSVVQLTPEQLRSAAALREKILKLENKLQKLLGVSEASPAPSSKGAAKKRTMSAAARAKIRKAQKARWARFHAAKKAKS